VVVGSSSIGVGVLFFSSQTASVIRAVVARSKHFFDDENDGRTYEYICELIITTTIEISLGRTLSIAE
jgi:hypothetical protein